ncbi:reticulophagy regulator 1-like isoform X1 [Diorhabda sublineata]|uniref:reticulophagy regulator 1-like isoform X1 n=1 Tax=Diorhabda sublineata TaxID=1163346 RepID=UPI0024E044DA|nr:reticulophagy regulator 1-like isoform X1 [Diorhabda sublineata]
MNFLKQKFYDIVVPYFSNRLETNNQQRVTKCGIYFEKVYQVLSWEDTRFSLVVFVIFNYLFWLLVHWQIRIFGLLFLIILILFIWDSFFFNDNQTDEQKKYTDMTDRMSSFIMDMIYNLKAFRKENSLMFCIGMSLVFFILNVIARNVSGYLFCYILLLLSFFIPLAIKLLPEETKTSMRNIIKSTFNIKGSVAEEELVPSLYDSHVENRDADLESLLTDRTADSASNSLASGITTMPSFLDMAEVEKDIEEEDLLPPYSHSDISSDSDIEHKELNIDSLHFNEDSSSSEEDKFLEKNTSFPKDYVDDSNSSTFANVQTNIDKIGNLVSNVLSYAQSIRKTDIKRENSSSDSEFEFVNSSDIKD